MSTTTPNFGWTIPSDTDLVTDGAAAMRDLGDGIDTSFVDLNGGTTGQILSKTSATDLDFTWITNDVGDITGVTAGTGLSGGGTSGAVTVSIDTAITVDKTTAQTLTNKTLTSPIISYSINAQTGATYTIVAADAGAFITTSNASANALKIPTDANATIAIGSTIQVMNLGAGTLTISAVTPGTTTITSAGASAVAPTVATSKVAQCVKIAADSWACFGAIG